MKSEAVVKTAGRSAPAARRLLIVNPNGNAAVTDLVREAAGRVLSTGTEATVLGCRTSPTSIETLEHRSRAEPLAIELLARFPGYDAYVMACFDDIAVAAGRRFLRAPVVAAAEASVAVARMFAARFTIVTTVETMVPGIRALLAGLGVADRATVRAAGFGVAAAAADSGDVEARLDAAILAARNLDGAGAIILGSGGLTGRSKDLAARHGLPVIDAIEAAIAMGEVAARLRADA
jgi:allantoin racemase